MTYAAATKYMHKSKTFVGKWVKRFEAHKNVDDLPEKGKTRWTSAKQDKTILKLFQQQPLLTLRQGQKLLTKKNIHVSIMTLKRRLNEANISWRTTMKKPFLKLEHVQKRHLWATQNLNRDWSNVIFTDEASFYAWSSATHAWSFPGKPHLQRTVKHPVKVHVWGCFSVHGFGTLYLFTQNLNATTMLKIYQRALLKSAETWYGADNESCILQEDNDPKHRSRLCTSWKVDNDIQTLDWPASRPMRTRLKMFGLLLRRSYKESVCTRKSNCVGIFELSGGLCHNNMHKPCGKYAQTVTTNSRQWWRMDNILSKCVIVPLVSFKSVYSFLINNHCCFRYRQYALV